jgi:hypothetical protein
MELNGIGGGLMLAVAAVLWMVYLIPSWLKRREYLSTERNAVRLQQTIRVLSETADLPVAPRAAQPVQPRAAQPVAASPRRPAAVRLRRTRATTSFLLLVAVVVAIVQTVLMASTGAVAAGWLVLGLSAIGAFGSVALLSRLAGVSRARSAAGAAPRAARTVRMSEPVESTAVAPVREWTPVRMPKPVYLSRPVVAPSTMSDPVVQAAAQVERAQRPPEREVTELDRRLAAMGIVDVPTGGAAPLRDLDAVLARRRAAG